MGAATPYVEEVERAELRGSVGVQEHKIGR